MLMMGKILRFDEVRGYGFIVPREGGEDVFMHANDLVDEKYLYQAGREVEFYLEMGDKGPKASEIRLVDRAPRRAPAPRADGGEEADELDDDTLDVLTTAEFRAELTEALIEADGTLTAAQLKRVRTRVLELARDHGWVEA
ncbi:MULTISPECIES: cold shock domain-containing protein [Streptomyces]|uniref:Cold shock protein CspV n=2 Tax=Streptomyces TaxID=1883 RepID=A0A1D8FW23_9ACTN|nr:MULTISPECIES: cold shock domain-containing protein [Streptomyces]AOT57412.1 Cold shock protein CspV [Streptomyces rubrolavendulae]KAF0648175.1 DNA-binding protein [Streptomyces fradiae ATCC 10745 = DSM 40063]OSY51548.1 Cold shock protein CspV [Streptomyces fradiae ATCC 10745 = DSM 40063]QEV10841.1 cold shock domain-containing protein [Streptomyces fradiae ATCC 10745 = DSM 40063]WOI60701.1 cold shock domain-containing protein [Streptomyces fradiae]